MKTIILSLIYFLTGTLYIALQPHLSFCPGLIIKSLIIPVLIFIFLINLKYVTIMPFVLMLAGLLFSLAGDIFIELSFIAGLICFLAAQIMYLIAFFNTTGENVILGKRFYLVTPVLIYGMVLITYLSEDLNGMFFPVLIYAITILTMLTAAINRLNKVNRLSFWMVFIGASLFVVSDSAIAVNRFSYPIKYSEWIIMTTYIAAQYFIIAGYIRQHNNKFV